MFIVGVLLCGRVQDHKEDARLRTRNTEAIKAICLEGAYIRRLHPTFDTDRLAGRLGRISDTLAADSLGGHEEAIAAVRALSESFLEMDRVGVSPEWIVGLKEQQALIVVNLMRADSNQRSTYLPGSPSGAADGRLGGVRA